MAENAEKTEKNEAEQQPQEEKEPRADSEQSEGRLTAGKTKEKTPGNSLVLWIILGGVVIVSAGGGYGAAKLFAGSSAQPRTEAEQSPSAESSEPAGGEELLNTDKKPSEQGTWDIDLEPVIANLNEPGVTRYVRATLTLEMSAEANKEKTVQFIEDKTPAIRNWLTIYLAGLTLEDVKGSRNLKRVQARILDSFNELLFADSKPLIDQVLFKEFAIQ